MRIENFVMEKMNKTLSMGIFDIFCGRFPFSHSSFVNATWLIETDAIALHTLAQSIHILYTYHSRNTAA